MENEIIQNDKSLSWKIFLRYIIKRIDLRYNLSILFYVSLTSFISIFGELISSRSFFKFSVPNF